MKIYQDVVYNHSSRWGAKGLFTPTVYGVRDAQWSWYYDEKNDGLRVRRPDRRAQVGQVVLQRRPVVDRRTGRQHLPQLGHAHRRHTAPRATPSTTASGPARPRGCSRRRSTTSAGSATGRARTPARCWLHDDLADFNTENAGRPELPDRRLQQVHRHGRRRVPRRHRRPHPAGHLEPPLPAGHLRAASPRSTARRRRRTSSSSARSPRSSTTSGTAARSTTPRSSSPGRSARSTAPTTCTAALEQYDYEEQLGTGNQPTSTNAFLNGNSLPRAGPQPVLRHEHHRHAHAHELR